MSINEVKKTVTYEEFGAVGDGVTDDFEAIAAAHAYANENELTVVGNPNATYYVGAKLTREIPVKYDVDFRGARFIVDDAVENAFENRSVYLFVLRRDNATVLVGDAITEAIGEGVTVRRGDRSFPWLSHLISEKSYVRLTNEGHRDFVRFGSNQNNGVPRMDIFEVDENGNLADDTEVVFEFDNITKIEIFSASESPITIRNGNFASVCCRASKETEYKNLYRSFNRGFYVERSNVTFLNMTHKMINEPELIFDSGKDELTKIYGERNESYPYQGFIVGRTAINLTIKDCLLTSHVTYYEDKPATVSTGWKVPNPVPMGSYDLYFHYCNHISLINLKHECPTGIADRRYWGIMASNNCKNFYIDGCQMNRFDAHQGFWGAVIKNSKFGFSINLTGGGKLYLENVTKITGDDMFSIRGDYGASFEGTVEVKNCRHEGYMGYNSNCGVMGPSKKISELRLFSMVYTGCGELFYNWDFGYELYLPSSVTVDGFECGANVPLYILSSEPDERFKNEYKHAHALIEKIKLSNVYRDDVKVAKDDACSALNSVPIECI